MTIWYLSSEKPQPFESVLALTQDELMVEAFWNRKEWICAYDTQKLEIKYWRFLPKFNESLLVKREVKKPERTDNKLLRKLTKVKYDKSGKMKVLDDLKKKANKRLAPIR